MSNSNNIEKLNISEIRRSCVGCTCCCRYRHPMRDGETGSPMIACENPAHYNSPLNSSGKN